MDIVKKLRFSQKNLTLHPFECNSCYSWQFKKDNNNGFICTSGSRLGSALEN